MIPIRRRLVGSTLGLLTLGALASRLALAQGRPVRIGYLAGRQNSVFLAPILKRMEELGYVEGKNLVVDYRSAEGVAERFPSLARDLIRAKNDLIIAAGPVQAALALREAKTDVPVVIVAVEYDPVKAGIVASLRRPGGNVTGISLETPALAVKRLDLLREILPKAKRFLVLADPFSKEQLEAVRDAGKRMQVEIVAETFTTRPYNYESAFANGRGAGVEAVNLLTTPVFYDDRTKIAEQVMKNRLASACTSAYMTSEAGFLIGHEPHIEKTYARVADITVRILKGAKPGDIPVEQPTEYEFVVHLKTAKALGISIPQSILLRATRVIE